jgi:hypothetical protein
MLAPALATAAVTASPAFAASAKQAHHVSRQAVHKKAVHKKAAHEKAVRKKAAGKMHPKKGKPAGVHPAAALSCRAIMTYGRPYQFTTTTLLVTTAAGAQVAAMAHYWTTVEPEGGIASKQGVARIPFYISWSRPGYPVDVTVQVNQGTRSASCSTSFVPRWT